MKMSSLARIFLLLTAILSAYEVAVGIDEFSTVPIIAYSIGFGVLLVATLLLLIWGYEALEATAVVIIATVIPLSLSAGLVWQHWEGVRKGYMVLAGVGFVAVGVTRTMKAPTKVATVVLALTHGMAGMIIFLLPLMLAALQRTSAWFSLVGLGGALIGLGGLALSFLKAGKPILPKERILELLPGLLFLTCVCFVLGFMYG